MTYVGLLVIAAAPLNAPMPCQSRRASHAAQRPQSPVIVFPGRPGVPVSVHRASDPILPRRSSHPPSPPAPEEPRL